MNNWVGGFIVFLYFANYHICEIFYPNGGVEWVKLKMAIYCVIILLALEYRKQNLFIEKLFIAIVLNNLYLLIFEKETNYSINDLIFIATFVFFQYLKQIKCSNK